jgi:hypothetical protein
MKRPDGSYFDDKFIGIEFKDNEIPLPERGRLSTHNLKFTTYQCESDVIRCMKYYTLDGLKPSKCQFIEMLYSDGWWDSSRYTSKDDAMVILFEDSLARYITRIVINIYGDDIYDDVEFNIQFKVQELGPGMETNIGPDLIEYIGKLFD